MCSRPKPLLEVAKNHYSLILLPNGTQAHSCPSLQVCGSLRSEPCTPLQCAGGDLCPPDGTPPCEKGEVCVGALPLSKRADADAKDVKGRLDKLTGKITDAAEKVHERACVSFVDVLDAFTGNSHYCVKTMEILKL